MDAVRQTLSFSIINILGTENNDSELQKSPRLSSGMKGDSTLPLSPSSSPDYEISKMDTVLEMDTKDAVSDIESELYDDKSHIKRPGRMRFTPAQIQALEKRFQKQHYLLPADRKFLAKSLHMTERQVKTWFQNKRAQYKRTRPLVRNPVYHHPSSPTPLTLAVPQLHLLQPRQFGINIQLPGLAHPALRGFTSTPPLSCTAGALPPHLPMPMAYVPVPLKPSK